MRKLFTVLVLGFLLITVSDSLTQSVSRKAMIDSLTSIDPEVKKYFPRWYICETDLQIQIHKTFQLLGYSDDDLDLTQIEVLATPRMDSYEPYEILMISCGAASMNASELETNLGVLVDFISGSQPYQGFDQGYAKRDYCYNDVPPSIPITQSQKVAISSFMEPTNVTHSFTISLFEQTLKVGESDFWLKSYFGNDAIGYPFWTAGEAKIVIKRPLYVNQDPNTRVVIPNLINAYLGASYRISAGLENKGSVFDFMPDRKLNGGINGKLVAGFDFHFPLHPFVGIHFNYEPPIRKDREIAIDQKSFGKYDVPLSNGLPRVEFDRTGEHRNDNVEAIIPVLGSAGQITIFYNWWLDQNDPENYFRFDAGLSYAEVQEYAYFTIDKDDLENRKPGQYLTSIDVNGLTLFKPAEFADWIFLKAEYRNQSTFPFGMSLQLSNQIFLGRIYIPLISPWLYLEAKYATPMRDKRPFETDNFFMLSPVLRITI